MALARQRKAQYLDHQRDHGQESDDPGDVGIIARRALAAIAPGVPRVCTQDAAGQADGLSPVSQRGTSESGKAGQRPSSGSTARAANQAVVGCLSGSLERAPYAGDGFSRVDSLPLDVGGVSVVFIRSGSGCRRAGFRAASGAFVAADFLATGADFAHFSDICHIFAVIGFLLASTPLDSFPRNDRRNLAP